MTTPTTAVERLQECNGFRCNHETSEPHYIISKDELLAELSRCRQQVLSEVGQWEMMKPVELPDPGSQLNGSGIYNRVRGANELLKQFQAKLAKQLKGK